MKKKKKNTRKSAKFKLEHHNETMSFVTYPGTWNGKQPGATNVEFVARPNTVTLSFYNRHDNKRLYSVELWMNDAEWLGKYLQASAGAARTLTLMYKAQDK